MDTNNQQLSTCEGESFESLMAKLRLIYKLNSQNLIKMNKIRIHVI